MPTFAYEERRGQVETYFDKTAVKNWSALTSDAPVSGIRKTVRAGRDRMRATILEWLPRDLNGARVLDAGCGTGAFAHDAAMRGADVVAVDLAPNLIAVAKERYADAIWPGRVDFLAGDLLDPALGQFDYVVSMDALIHYEPRVAVDVIGQIAERASQGIVFTFVPRTAALSLMFAVGRCFPQSRDGAPSINLVSERAISRQLAESRALVDWDQGRTERVNSGFYTSQAMEITRA
ncbi:MAG: magnesium protoporphyrin IX methyltransferase [Pseudomonadota bacterium]